MIRIREPHDGAPLKPKPMIRVFACQGGPECNNFTFETVTEPSSCPNCGSTQIYFAKWKEDAASEFVRTEETGRILVQDPNPNWTDDEVVAYVDEVSRALQVLFAAHPAGKTLKVYLVSENRGGDFFRVGDAIATLIPEMHDRAQKYKAEKAKAKAPKGH